MANTHCMTDGLALASLVLVQRSLATRANRAINGLPDDAEIKSGVSCWSCWTVSLA